MTVTHSSMARVVLAAFLACTTVACSTDAAEPERGPGIEPDQAAAAETLCPLLWEWTTSVGEAFNDTSRGVADLDGAAQRRAAWDDLLDRLESLDQQLLSDVGAIGATPVLEPLVADVRAGIDRSLAEIAELRQLIVDTPELDEQRHQARTQQLIVRVEKVIDVVKPSLSEHDLDGTLVDAFREVPSCQHAVKDADDGVGRFNG